jgi:3'-phosphoadenosine 5'-phosphosulfate sulfotransferase (PAPS reductase)/FAD synthetase
MTASSLQYGPFDAPRLQDFDIILVNTSAGKDSQAMLDDVCRQADAAGVRDRVHAVHADLGRAEWERTKELAKTQCDFYNVPLTVCRRQQNDLVDQIWARWEQLKSDGRNVPPYPSKPNRFCTSDHKRGPIRTVMTKLVRELDAGRKVRILNCVGLRAEESSDRATCPACKGEGKVDPATGKKLARKALSKAQQALVDALAGHALAVTPAVLKALETERPFAELDADERLAANFKAAGWTLVKAAGRTQAAMTKRGLLRDGRLTDAGRAYTEDPTVPCPRCEGTGHRPTMELSDASNQTKREVWDWLPVHGWTETDVWNRINESGCDHHVAYDLGMPRLSCCFCIFAPKACEIERATGFTFKQDVSLCEVQAELKAGWEPPKNGEKLTAWDDC